MPHRNKPRFIIIHHSAVNTKIQPFQFEPINRYHKMRWNFISSLGLYGGYHYLIEKNGEIKQYRAETEEGAHCRGLNTQSIGICLAGNFSEQLPSEKQERSLAMLLREIMERHNISVSQIYGHRYFSKTECPGKNIPDDYVKIVLNKYSKKEEVFDKSVDILNQVIKLLIKLQILLKVGSKKED